MDDSEDESMYLPKPSFRSKPPIRNPHSFPTKAQFQNDKAFQQDDDELDDAEDNPVFNRAQNEYHYNSYYDDEPKNNKKRRKMESLPSTYEFAPRAGMNLPKSSHAGGSSRESWNEEESFVLLEVWGERYLELGRRSLRAEDWSEVAEKVSEMSGTEKSEMQCRNQLDVLKKKYKKERAKSEKIGGGFASKWVFFKKMDVLLNLRMRGHCGLGCGLDSGEYVFMNPRVYLDKSNVLDEMRDSPGQSDDENEEDEGFGGHEDEKHGESARLLADSIQRFGEIYEKIESSKRKQMMELEKMRRDFQRDLELQKKQIVERAQAEIAKIRERDDDLEDGDEEDDDNDDDDNDNGDVPDANTRN
ncbi:hypothetical protein M9H77_01804 [Catharanthus roseus]|uniref:Uncharacterized protein n=1 Tax=Catharanthus roseus TaxID=4058 RepID=A0ACC0C6U6_CATRO|nr:hypothetical protein M9H77_01804 [Catharanthus roseus]